MIPPTASFEPSARPCVVYRLASTVQSMKLHTLLRYDCIGLTSQLNLMRNQSQDKLNTFGTNWDIRANYFQKWAGPRRWPRGCIRMNDLLFVQPLLSLSRLHPGLPNFPTHVVRKNNILWAILTGSLKIDVHLFRRQ
jgi:hypothetical protein